MDEMNVKAVETTENKEIRPKIIAVDFDGCLVTNKFPEVGDPINKTLSRLKQEQANGAKVILWTNRRDKPLDDAVKFCEEQGIHLDAINANLPEIIEAFGGDTRKIFAVVMRDSVRNARAWYSLIVIVGCSFLHVVGVFSYGCFLASS